MTESNVVRQGAEKRDAGSNQHRHTSDNEPIHQPRAQKLLNRDASVDVQMTSTALREPGNEIRWRSCHLFNDGAGDSGQANRSVT